MVEVGSCGHCGGRGWLAARDAKTAHMRDRTTLRPCPHCNRVESDELERAASRTQRELREMLDAKQHPGDC